MSASEWDEYADDWDANNDVQRYALKALESLQQKVFPLVPDLATSRLLDFGCGTGLLTEKLAAFCQQIVAVDTSEEMLKVLRRKLESQGIENATTLNVEINANSIATNAELLPGFDLILASSVCSFLPDYESTLADLSSIMKPGAFFVQWDWLSEMPAERIEGAFSGAGLSPQSINEAFVMDAENQPAVVIIGIGRFEGGLT